MIFGETHMIIADFYRSLIFFFLAPSHEDFWVLREHVLREQSHLTELMVLSWYSNVINHRFLMVNMPPIQMVMNGGWLMTLLYQHYCLHVLLFLFLARYGLCTGFLSACSQAIAKAFCWGNHEPTHAEHL